MRKKIFDIIEAREKETLASKIYGGFLLLTIVASFMPLFFKELPEWYQIIDTIVLVIFIIDYFLRWIVADYLHGAKIKRPFLYYPFSKMAIIDLVSIIPWLFPINHTMQIFRVVRMFRALRVLKVLKYVKSSSGIQIILRIFRRQKSAILITCWIAIGYVLISATVVFNVEPETFETFFDAVYWAIVSLTTVGYGDIYPVSLVGRIVTMISAIFGIAIVAMPAGIITAGFLEELKEDIEKGNHEKGNRSREQVKKRKKHLNDRRKSYDLK